MMVESAMAGTCKEQPWASSHHADSAWRLAGGELSHVEARSATDLTLDLINGMSRAGKS